MPGPIDASGLVPTTVAAEIHGIVAEASVVLRFARRLPMPTGATVVPVLRSLPKAGWVGAPGGRKPFTDLNLDPEMLKAEEVAATIAIPDSYLDDSSVHVWNYARPLLAEAIGTSLDDAVLWGVDAPPTFPAGGIIADATVVPAGTDPLATVNDAMAAVESGGLPVTGSAADLAVRGALRGLRDENGALLLGPADAASAGLQTLYGAPIVYASVPAQSDYDFITGDWPALILGVRQDIRYQLSSDGVIADDAGKIVLSAFQDNVTLMKVWARFGCVLVKPVTRRSPQGAEPFAVASVVPPPAGTGGASASEPAAQATKSTATTAKR